jgi:hypothetical protein
MIHLYDSIMNKIFRFSGFTSNSDLNRDDWELNQSFPLELLFRYILTAKSFYLNE